MTKRVLVFLTAFSLGILGLAVWGGYTLNKVWGGQSSDCYFYMTGPQLCVTHRAPSDDSVAYAQAARYQSAVVACFGNYKAEKAAEFVKNSGKRICGQFSIQSPPPPTAAKLEAAIAATRRPGDGPE